MCVWGGGGSHCTHSSSLSFVTFFYSLSLFISVFYLFFLDSIPSYGNSYCSTDSVMCIYCSICKIGGTGRKNPLLFNNRRRAFSPPWAVPDAGVASCQADCYIGAECQPSPPRQRSTRHIFNNKRCNWLQSGSVSEPIPVRAQLALPCWCRKLGRGLTQGSLWLIDSLNRHTHTHTYTHGCI